MHPLIGVLVVLFVSGRGCALEAEPPSTECPSSSVSSSRCTCDRDGTMRWRVDCVDVGLNGIPSNLSVYTSYLDLSMNNIYPLPSRAFSNLHLLQELHLAGNSLTDIPKDAFAGLRNLKVLKLQNNLLSHIPSEALQNLRNLQSLRLDANSIGNLHGASFKGLRSLRYLWLDDNALTQVPVEALGRLPALQAVNLALNNITHVPDRAFGNLSHLVVIHLHDNQIHSLGERCFDGLQNLVTLDLSSNRLDSFPTAIRAVPSLKELLLQSNHIESIPGHAFIGNPSIETINLQNNPVQVLGQSAFQHLPELRTLSLSGAQDITVFPDLTGANRLETLSITGTHISSVPSSICELLPSLQQLDLSHNWIQCLPNFTGCGKIQRLDLTSNRLSSFSLEGLHGLTHLKLSGNLQLRDPLPLHLLPSLRVAELPFAYQCCVFATWAKSKCPFFPWNLGSVDNSNPSLNQQESYDVTFQEYGSPEDLAMEPSVDGTKQAAVRCSPVPGPFHPCQSSFATYWYQFVIWVIIVLSITFNFLVLFSIFSSALRPHPVQHLLGVLYWVHFLTGLSSGTLAVVDVLTVDHGGGCPWWELEARPWTTNVLFALSSEAGVLLMTAVVFEQMRCSDEPKKAGRNLLPGKRRRGVQVVAAVCCTLVLCAAASPFLFRADEHSLTSIYMSFSHNHSICWGYNSTLLSLNFLCYLLMTATHCRVNQQPGGEEMTLKPNRVHQDRATMTKTVTAVLLSNCLLCFSATLLPFMLRHRHPSLVSSPELIRFTALLTMSLPACLDPLLYMFLSLRFRVDLGSFLQWTSHTHRSHHSSSSHDITSVNSEDPETQSCTSTQALVVPV